MYRSTESSTTLLDPSHRSSILVPSYSMCSLYRNTNGRTIFNKSCINKFLKCHTQLFIPEFNP